VRTGGVDPTLRPYPGAPQSGDFTFGLAAADPAISLSIPVLDMEPYTVESGQATTRGVKFVPLGPLDTLDESPGSFFVASAVEAPGLAGAFFSTDGWLRNDTNVDDLPVEFWYTPAGRDGIGGGTRRLELELDPGGASPFSAALKAAQGAVSELQREVEAGYLVELT